MPNRLINETSPYLQQHANNPVNWFPWSEEALERAKQEDKPILLSVGYSACHWCHVMERESFENPKIAEAMNRDFISIKVDREERPDIDSIYMLAVQAMTGRGGWPMTVFLMPDGKPFYGGTYFPPEDRHGMPGFPKVLKAIANFFQNHRDDALASTEKLIQHLNSATTAQHGIHPLSTDILTQVYNTMLPQFEHEHGGFGLEPKFPQPMNFEFLLRYHHRYKDAESLDMVEHTLTAMASGGIYDQIGGGFHRYSTDSQWLVPHFEKMLYDNALLSRLYLHTYQVTKNPYYKRIAEETLNYVLREMTSSEGGFFSAQDADSEGTEGKFFVWKPNEIVDALGPQDGNVICKYYGVSQSGNFEGRNILYVPNNVSAAAKQLGMSEEELDIIIHRSRPILLHSRDKRIHPNRDDKVLTAWNGMMLRSFAEAASILNRNDYREAAERNAGFLLNSLKVDGRILRTYKDGQAKFKGYLEDYAHLIDGLLALHETTFNAHWLKEAITLGKSMMELFWDETNGVFYDTATDHETLIVRPRDIFDNAMPCGSSTATDVILRLAILTGNEEYEHHANTSLQCVRHLLMRAPTGFGHWICALDFYLSTPKEIVIAGDPLQHATHDLLAEVYRDFLPSKVLVGTNPGDPVNEEDIPLAKYRRTINGNPTAYVCQDFICRIPTTKPKILATQLSD